MTIQYKDKTVRFHTPQGITAGTKKIVDIEKTIDAATTVTDIKILLKKILSNIKVDK